jgi:hypothetical protein
MKKRAKELFAEPDPEEARARRRAAKTLPEGFSVDEVTEFIEANVSEYRRKKRASFKKLYGVLCGIYDKFLFLNKNRDEQKLFLVECIRKDIIIKAGTDLSVVLIRFHLSPSKEATSRYAHVLREAAFQGIGAGELATTLRKKGSSIKAMARQFTDRRNGESEKAATTHKTIKLPCSDRLWEQWNEDSRPVLRLTVKRQANGDRKATKISGPKQRTNGNSHRERANSATRRQQQKLIRFPKV